MGTLGAARLTDLEHRL